MNRLFLNILWILALTACADGITVGLTGGEADDDTDVIHVGGLTGDELTIEVDNSRAVTATDAELVPWLINPLFEGFHIAYYRGNNAAEKRHARLTLLRDGDTYKQSESGLAEYSFMETSSGVLTGKKAKWAGNGAHRFEGHYVPEQIRNEVPDAGAPNNLDNDQSDDSDTGNYTLLMRYLSMPANHDINATIGRVKLPFYHRLCRVNAFVLINPDMGSDVKLEGYDISVGGKDDPTTTTLRFENVKVLRHVERTVEDGNEMFTPHWETVRRVIPHSEGEYGSMGSNANELYHDFILFESVEDGTPLFPSNDEAWKQVKDAFDAAMNKYYADNGINAETATNAEKQAAKAYAEGVTKYRMTNYGKVPVYNIIVRPTYTSAENVMYDEPAGITHEEKNSITFVLRLNNGLEYEKMFTFDLDANRQTAVYLRINREAVDYNTSGSEVWDKNDFSDGYYGVNNENGNSLSIAGSSWQRAYRNNRGGGPADITDGSDYNENDEADHIAGEDGQYISDEKWTERFLEATKEGKHHGDYFILDRDITISATKIPVDFVFTGHLDARGHKITLTDCGTEVTDVAEWWEDNYQLADDYSGDTYYMSDGAGNFRAFTMPDNIYKKTKDAVPEQSHEATQEDVEAGLATNIGDKVVDVEAQPAEYEQITTIAEMMGYAGQLYEKTANGTYVEYTKPTLYVNDVIHHPAVTHTSPGYLFAGLNGIYTTAQESNPALPAEQWEANVHKEGSYWVPVGGYRAEVLNTTVAGATLFKDSYTTGSTEAADVSGNVQNCSDHNGKVPNYSNGIPKY